MFNKYSGLGAYPHVAVLVGMIKRSPERAKMCKNGDKPVLMTWKCKYKINPHEPEKFKRLKVIRSLIANHLPPGEYTPRIFTEGGCRDLDSIVVSEAELRAELRLKRF